MLTISDFIAQATILALILLALWHRDMLPDFTDGNIERLIRIEENAAEARGWLDQMGAWK